MGSDGRFRPATDINLHLAMSLAEEWEHVWHDVKPEQVIGHLQQQDSENQAPAASEEEHASQAVEVVEEMTIPAAAGGAGQVDPS